MNERLQKIIARAGVASRRKAEEMIREGRVAVNGQTVALLGSKADPDVDEIRVDGCRITVESELVYLLLYKPAGYVTTSNDPQGRPIVTDLIRAVPERLYPVGRLDYDSEGLLILTNDGQFAHKIQHPRHGILKSYLVKVRGVLNDADIAAIGEGRHLEDGFFRPREVRLERRNPKSTWLTVSLTEGRNRIIRRYFDTFGHPAARLIRTSIGHIEVGSLKEGEYRMLRKREVEALMAGENTGERAKKILTSKLK
ncbi:MAG: rRNA pseudouridine synthase [Deltaproteobacteria bacterium]|nr:rRNA pseudouridine synthase [Deltaproteobacteria bacterium]